MFKVNNKDTQRHWRRSGVIIVNFGHISHLALVFLLLTCNCRLELLFEGLLNGTLLVKNSFRDFAKISSSIFYTLCCKKYVSINWLSVNSTTTKHIMFQVISKNIYWNWWILIINRKHTKFSIVLESLFWTSIQVYNFPQCFYRELGTSCCVSS